MRLWGKRKISEMSLPRVCLLFPLVVVALSAQRSKYTSPQAQTSLLLDGKNISVEYYAPSMHGRKVMDGLVPYGQVWCTGANWATKLTTDADLEIGSLKLPKGSYSIWTVPNEKQWTLIINRQTGQFHLNYDQNQDLGRTPMQMRHLDAPVETFRIQLVKQGPNRGRLLLVWENTEASAEFTVK
jgi:hypothetical protein